MYKSTVSTPASAARFMKAAALVLGGVAVAAMGVVGSALLGYTGAGPGVAAAAVLGGVYMTDRGLRTW